MRLPALSTFLISNPGPYTFHDALSLPPRPSLALSLYWHPRRSLFSLPLSAFFTSVWEETSGRVLTVLTMPK